MAVASIPSVAGRDICTSLLSCPKLAADCGHRLNHFLNIEELTFVFASAHRCIHEDGQIYTPPYLLKSDGSLATRPSLNATSRAVPIGGTITASTNQPISKFSLIRRGCAWVQ